MTTAISSESNESGSLFDAMAEQVRESLNNNTGQLFTTDAPDLFEIYINALPGDRQHHMCNTCKDFLRRYGGLVTIEESGITVPVMWEFPTSGFYGDAVAALRNAVKFAKVTGPFVTSETRLGNGRTGEWTHFSVTNPNPHRNKTKAAHEVVAEKLEDFRTVQRALGEYTQAMLEQAVTLLKSDHLYRQEKVIGPAKWLLALQEIRKIRDQRVRHNLMWREIASAPAGFCHPRSSMIGTLLDDLKDGYDFDSVQKRFAAKMHPLQYQRPSAPPKAGNIAVAEKRVEQLGIHRSLLRRYARVEELKADWTPTPSREEKTDGVFGHLKAKAPVTAMQLPKTTMTWVKFQATVLPDARKIEALMKTSAMPFVALVTAVDPDSPPIIQWDTEEQRNPVSWYLWHGANYSKEWGLRGGSYVEVTAITKNPAWWYGPSPNQKEGVVFVLKGAKDTRAHMASLALFPEILKSSLHEVRSVIEAHSRSQCLEGVEEASANGLLLSKSVSFDVTFRVTTNRGTQEYLIDRWD
jgi:hypothetical protein